MTIFKPDVPRIAINAEHQRLMWLNFSPALIAGLILVYGFFCLLGFDPAQFSTHPEDFYHHLAIVGRFGYGFSLLAILILIKNSIEADLKSQFWDQLRMSSLSAWQMTWTRLFTAPLIAWLSLIVASLLATIGSHFESTEDVVFSPIIVFLFHLLFAVFFACTALINCLQFGRSQKEWQGNILQIILLYFVLTICLQALPESLDRALGNPSHLLDENISLNVLIGFVIILVTYIGLGVWRSMSYKLHLKPSQSYWLYATIALPFILTIYHLIWNEKIITLLFYMTLIYISAVVFSLTLQHHHLAQLKNALQHFKQQQWKKAFIYLPAWVYFLILCFLLIPVYFIALPHELGDYLSCLFMILAYITAVLFSLQMSRRFNAITIAMIAFLIFRWSLFLFQ